MPASVPPISEEDTTLVYLPGFPGYRNRPGRSGLDYLDNQFELAHMTGLMLRKLITGAWRKKGSVHSFWVTLVAAIVLAVGGNCNLVLALFIIGVAFVFWSRRQVPAEEAEIESKPTDWKEFISSAYQENPENAHLSLVFYPPASAEEILAAENRLGVKFPDALRELLLQTNGFTEERLLENGQKSVDMGSFLMPLKVIIEVSASYRNSGLPANIDFTEMIFFLNTHTDGIYFAIRSGQGDVYIWYPADRVFRPVSGSLDGFLWDWLSGFITI